MTERLPSLSTMASDQPWVQTARRARLLSWLSLAWMTVEGVVGLIARLEASARSVVVWASSSFVEGLASMFVIWRLSGSRTVSESSERTSQRLVAGSFLLLVSFFVFAAIHRLLTGSDTRTSVLGMAVTARRSSSCRLGLSQAPTRSTPAEPHARIVAATPRACAAC